MKYKKSIIIMIFGISLIIIGLIANIIIGINEEKKQVKETADSITSKYATFVKDVEDFSDAKKDLDSSIFDDLYNEYVETEYENWITTLNEYTDVAETVIAYQDFIMEYCANDRIYEDREVNNACESFKLNLEGTINYYVKDITKFNDFISEYNEQLTDTLKIKKLYELTYDYTDINEDRNYVGKTD